jgi:proprotein convertase subtilisin/kexin type 5
MLQRELIRILAFHPNHFGYFPGGASATYAQAVRSTISGPKSGYKIITAGVVAWARIHFQCPTLDGVFLEDEVDFLGGWAFWESTVLGYELLSASPPYDAPLSMFTLMLIQDSGWYTVDTGQAEQIDFGRLAGCAFFDISLCSPAVPEFCQVAGINSCSRSHVFRTRCKSTIYSNGCVIGLPLGNSRCASKSVNFDYLYDDESPGPLSKCHQIVVGDVPSSACMSTFCLLNGTMQANFTGITYECTESKQSIRIAPNMNLTCPIFRRTCFDAVCVGQCYGSGICRENGTCTCDYFFSGNSCQTYGGCQANVSNICSLIVPTGNLTIPSIPVQTFNLTNHVPITSLPWLFLALSIPHLLIKTDSPI